MVCTIKQKLCTARNRAKFAYYKFIVVDRVMIQYIVFFKVLRVVYKIIIKRKISDFDIRVCYYIFQIYNLFVLTARIFLCCPE